LLTENLKACKTSDDFSSIWESRPCPDDSGDVCEVPAPAAEQQNSAAADAFARARGRGASMSEEHTSFTARVRPATPPSPVDSTRGSLPPSSVSKREKDRLARTKSKAKVTVVDPLDAALEDFLGDNRRVRRDSEDIRLIFGRVFDPEKAAAELTARSNHVTRGNKLVVTEDSFGWDDDELDAPIEPEDVRRKVGSRTDGVPQFGILRKWKKDS
jgi:hypothetical protein